MNSAARNWPARSLAGCRAVIEDNRVGLSYLEKSSRYVPFDDRVDGQFRYYRPARVLQSRHGAEYIAAMDGLFESYARNLPVMIEHLAQQHPIQALEFENARTGEVARFDSINDETMRKSAQFATGRPCAPAPAMSCAASCRWRP